MSLPENARARIGALDERVARLRAERSRLLARISQAERKRDTRRKILIGGAVLAAIEHEGVPVLKSTAELLRWLDVRLLRPHDRAVFELGARARRDESPFGPSQQSARSEAAVKEADRREAPRSGAPRP